MLSHQTGKNRKSAKFESITKAGGRPDEKIFTPTDERGFFPYTPHPTPHTRSAELTAEAHTPHPAPRKNFFGKP